MNWVYEIKCPKRGAGGDWGPPPASSTRDPPAPFQEVREDVCALVLRAVSCPDVLFLLKGSIDKAVPSLARVGATGLLSRCVPRTSVFTPVITRAAALHTV